MKQGNNLLAERSTRGDMDPQRNYREVAKRCNTYGCHNMSRLIVETTTMILHLRKDKAKHLCLEVFIWIEEPYRVSKFSDDQQKRVGDFLRKVSQRF